MKLFYRVSLCFSVSFLIMQAFIAAPSVQPTVLNNQALGVSTSATQKATTPLAPAPQTSQTQVTPIQPTVVDKTYTEWKDACRSYSQEISDAHKELSDLFEKLTTQQLVSLDFSFEKTKTLPSSHITLKTTLAQTLADHIVTQEKPLLIACSRAITRYPLSKNEWLQTRDHFVQTCTQQIAQASWVGGAQNPPAQITQGVFKPYAQKLTISAGSTLTIIGDLHGDVDALINTLDVLVERGVLDDTFKLKKSHYVIFLGDYTDRGSSGVEVLYGVFRLKTANPQQVVVLRGNHEDRVINESSSKFLGTELALKLGLTTPAERTKNVYKLYNLMPVALYVHTPNNDCILLTHGGLECGFDPSPLLKAPASTTCMDLGTINRKTAVKQINTSKNTLQITVSPQKLLDKVIPTTPSDLHFLWNDFSEQIDTHDNTLHNIGWEYGELLTQALLKRDGVKAVIRGHNHLLSLEGKGLYSLYNGLVTTVTSFRNHGTSIFFSEYSFITLTVHTHYANWQATHERDGKKTPLILGNAQTHIPMLNKKKATLPQSSTQARQTVLKAHKGGLS